MLNHRVFLWLLVAVVYLTNAKPVLDDTSINDGEIFLPMATRLLEKKRDLNKRDEPYIGPYNPFRQNSRNKPKPVFVRRATIQTKKNKDSSGLKVSK
ncbi:hypothetical protein O181_048129 [Austropuccinia psidii MF-1]|uniref:Uncharacterized protein n=1 Tax=Austropuccinia psidii MF-1 TaxID=1389203 RepID=A0A9Q3DS80_9BASI|nr:hypothetical protein [Austropuccinia psidii MF-1]